MYDVIIIGGGPAGLTAALYTGRSRLKTLLLEKLSLGGQILKSEFIENFPGFPGGVPTHELINRMHKQVKDLGVKIELEEVLDLDCKSLTVKTEANTYSAKAIIISTGARPKKLNVPGEERLTGRGVSYCATCDAAFFKDKRVVVLGGGNTVAEESMYLTRFAKSVTIIHRRDNLRASAILQERLKENKKIHFTLSHIVTEITGTDRVEAVKIKDVNSSEEKTFPCDGVFIFVGYEPETAAFKDKIKLDEAGFIITGHDLSTSEDGVFACGDCRVKSLYQVVTACGDGAVAADSANKYIEKKAK